MEHVGIAFEVPWDDLDLEKTRREKEVAIFGFHSGIGVVFVVLSGEDGGFVSQINARLFIDKSVVSLKASVFDVHGFSISGVASRIALRSR